MCHIFAAWRVNSNEGVVELSPARRPLDPGQYGQAAGSDSLA